jgi:catechol 2,3-dioxygenase-like lactoylglutathione lyase family enzyme
MRKLTLVVFAVVTAALQGQAVTGTGNFSHIVVNLDKSLEFYRDVLGLEVATPPGAFSPNPAIMKLGDTVGGQSRMTQLKVPGSAIGVEIIEYKDIDRKPAHPRFQDPGAANLSLRAGSERGGGSREEGGCACADSGRSAGDRSGRPLHVPAG